MECGRRNGAIKTICQRDRRSLSGRFIIPRISYRRLINKSKCESDATNNGGFIRSFLMPSKRWRRGGRDYEEEEVEGEKQSEKETENYPKTDPQPPRIESLTHSLAHSPSFGRVARSFDKWKTREKTSRVTTYSKAH